MNDPNNDATSGKDKLRLAKTGYFDSAEDYRSKTETNARYWFGYLALIGFLSFSASYVFLLPEAGIDERGKLVFTGFLPIISSIITYYFTSKK